MGQAKRWYKPGGAVSGRRVIPGNVDSAVATVRESRSAVVDRTQNNGGRRGRRF